MSLPKITPRANPKLPTTASNSVGGVTLNTGKDGQVAPKPVSEFSKEAGAPTPLPIGKLVDVAFPPTNPNKVELTVIDRMLMALSKSLTAKAGGEWKDRLVEVAAMLKDDPDCITILSDSQLKTIAEAFTVYGSTDTSRVDKGVKKSVSADPTLLKATSELNDLLGGSDFDDFGLGFVD